MSRSTPLLVIVTASIPRGSLDEGIAAPLVPDLTPGHGHRNPGDLASTTSTVLETGPPAYSIRCHRSAWNAFQIVC